MLAKRIESLQHPLIKHWLELRSSRAYREETKRVLIAGEKMASELPLETLISLEPSDIPAKEKYLVSEAILRKITGLQAPDGFAAEVALPPEQNLQSKPYLLVLDQLSDPGNLGTLIRTALALNWDGVLLTPNTVDPFNDKAVRASMGAVFLLPYQRISTDALSSWKRTFFTADLEGKELSTAKFSPPLALILSNESAGPSDWSDKLSTKITIPMSGKTESLNVAASGAIFLYTMRQS